MTRAAEPGALTGVQVRLLSRRRANCITSRAAPEAFSCFCSMKMGQITTCSPRVPCIFMRPCEESAVTLQPAGMSTEKPAGSLCVVQPPVEITEAAERQETAKGKKRKVESRMQRTVRRIDNSLRKHASPKYSRHSLPISRLV